MAERLSPEQIDELVQRVDQMINALEARIQTPRRVTGWRKFFSSRDRHPENMRNLPYTVLKTSLQGFRMGLLAAEGKIDTEVFLSVKRGHIEFIDSSYPWNFVKPDPNLSNLIEEGGRSQDYRRNA